MVRLAKKLPGLSVSAVSPGQIDAWLREQTISPVTRNNYRRHLSSAFGFARRKGWCRANPCGDVSTASTPAQPVRILTPEQAEALLRVASPEIVAWFALGLFAGLRPMEAARLSWSDIGNTSIRIHATIAKTRRNRFVPVLDPLPEWLALAKRHRRGTIGYSDTYFRRAAEAAGLRDPKGGGWPADCLRHSFGSYRAVQISLTDLARDMGNSESIIISHYREVTDRETAEKFFSIRP